MKKTLGAEMAVLVAALFLCSSTAFAQKYVPAFPREGATKLMEAGHIEIWEVIRDKGKPSPMFQVPLDQVSFTLTEGAVKFTKPDGSVRIEQERLGFVRYESKGTVTQEEGLNEIPNRVIVARIKDGPPAKLAPVVKGMPGQFPRLDATKLFENDRLIVWDQVWLPNRPVTNHLHYNQAMFVFIQAGELRTRSLGKTAGKPFSRYIGSITIIKDPMKDNIPHEEEWVSGEPRALWVELK